MDIEKIAELSMLRFSEEEKMDLTSDLKEIMEYASILFPLAETDVIPDFSVDWREDVVVPSFSRDDLLTSCPHKEDAYLCVPKVITE